MTTQELGHELRRLRRKAKLTVTQLAAAAGLHHATVYNAESGKPITTDTLCAILTALGYRLALRPAQSRSMSGS